MIKIEAQKIIVKGKQFIKIARIEMLKYDELPCMYTNGMSCWYDGGGFVIYKNGKQETESHFMALGTNLYTEEEFIKKTGMLRRCANRLKAVNEILNRENSNWKGSVVISI